MFELISYEKFRDTKDVRFFDISVNESNYRDLVIHSGPAVSPPNDEEFKNWQFYITVESEFKVTNSKDNKKLLDCITNLEPRFKIYSVK